MQGEAGRQALQPRVQFLQAPAVERGIRRIAPVGVEKRPPVHPIFAAVVGQGRARHRLAGIEAISIAQAHPLEIRLGDDTVLQQALMVDLVRGRVGLDGAVHARLRDRRFIGLVMTLAAVADHVDEHVAGKGHAVFQRQPGDQQHRLGVIAIDMEDRCLNHLDDIGAILGRTRVEWVRGGEADLVVDDDMDRAAGGEAAGLGQVQGLHDHPLTGERRVAVDQDRQHLDTADIVAALLAGAHRALDHRVDDLQMGRIEGQGQMDRSPR